jgi:hypothetical protein
MDDVLPNINDFRIVGGKYFHNNQEVSPEEYSRRQTLADKAMKDFREAPTPGFEDLENWATEAKARAAARRKASGKKSGGSINVPKSKVSTHQKSKKASSW